MMPIEPLREASEQQLEVMLEQFKELDHHDLSECETKSICGPLVWSIKNIEDSLNEDVIIIMGTRGVTGIGELFFGTMTASTIKHVKSPVICVPNTAHLMSPKNIMLSIDKEGLTSRAEIQPLLDLAETWGSEIKIVNIDEGEEVLIEESKKRIVMDHHLSNNKHSYHSIPGSFKEDELTSFAKASKIDLMALIKRDKGFWRNFFHNSLSKRMSFYSEIPLLILRDSVK
jgi:nucleotide-binding universal stress UspA family protein